MAITSYSPPGIRTPSAPRDTGASPGIAAFDAALERRKGRKQRAKEKAEKDRRELLQITARNDATRALNALESSGELLGKSADEQRTLMRQITDPVERRLTSEHPTEGESFGEAMGILIDQRLAPQITAERQNHATQLASEYAAADRRIQEGYAEAAQSMLSPDAETRKLGFERIASIAVEEDGLIGTQPEHLREQYGKEALHRRAMTMAYVYANHAINAASGRAAEEAIRRISNGTDFMSGSEGDRWTRGLSPKERYDLIGHTRSGRTAKHTAMSREREILKAHEEDRQEKALQKLYLYGTKPGADGRYPTPVEIRAFALGSGLDADIVPTVVSQIDGFVSSVNSSDDLELGARPDVVARREDVFNGVQSARSVYELDQYEGILFEMRQRGQVDTQGFTELENFIESRRGHLKERVREENATERMYRRKYRQHVERRVLSHVGGFVTSETGQVVWVPGSKTAKPKQRHDWAEVSPALETIFLQTDGSDEAARLIGDLGVLLAMDGEATDDTDFDPIGRLGVLVGSIANLEGPEKDITDEQWMNVIGRTDRTNLAFDPETKRFDRARTDARMQARMPFAEIPAAWLRIEADLKAIDLARKIARHTP